MVMGSTSEIFYKKFALGRVGIGILSGIITIILLKIDQIEPTSMLSAGHYFSGYTTVMIVLYVLIVMNFLAGIKGEYGTSLSYVIFLALYDFVTDGLATILLASVSFISLLASLGFSRVSRKLGIKI